MKIFSPVVGSIKQLAQVEDEAFSTKVMGEGVAVVPYNGQIVSPVNGTVSMIFPTNHAIGIISDEGVEILIHIGIDTVELNGQGFKSFVNANQRVKVKDLLVEVDLDVVKSKYASDVMIIITNTPNYKTITPSLEKEVVSGDCIIEVE